MPEHLKKYVNRRINPSYFTDYDKTYISSYDIYDEAGNTVYVVKGQLSWGHKLVIYDAYGNEVGMVVPKKLQKRPSTVCLR